MPPLERRLPHAMVIAESAGEIDDPKAAARRLRQRLHRSGGGPSAEPAASPPRSCATRHRVAVAGRGLVLSTRNPLVVWLAKNEFTLSFLVIAAVHLCRWAGYEWPSAWLSIQHQARPADAPGGARYVRGIHDITFVVYWIFQIVAARAVMLQHVLPVIPRYFGITSDRKQRRFGEMGWFVTYILASLTVGIRVWQASPYYMNTRNLYANYPEDHVLMPYGLKWYYLVQTAFWISNLYTIFVEERRKDHLEMLAHHVVTIALVTTSYHFHFTRFGHVFMLVMDFPDVFLSPAKMVRYLGGEIVPNILFGAFTVSWVMTKHYLCLKLMFSIWTQGIYEVPPEKRFPTCPDSYASYPIVGAMWAVLCILQAILVYWFVLILRVLQRVLVNGEDAQDSRSDDEGDDDNDGANDNATTPVKTKTPNVTRRD
ncbi:Sphingosine N-acyltransferase lag1 [Coemansia javaensis]|uniref:Sphingosine N-acyltransferase lag1 n=1 Tax=Coemansia javaensis TaxID=2761396 RepID=A0A9W8LGT8_9FUNG|nr:Sphingosine N-acyltransferase lag1 [Coemansia javaensis]